MDKTAPNFFVLNAYFLRDISYKSIFIVMVVVY